MSLSKEIQLGPRAAAAPRLYYPFIPAAAAAGAARAQRARWPVTWPVRAHGTARAAPPVRGCARRGRGLRLGNVPCKVTVVRRLYLYCREKALFVVYLSL